MIILGLDPGVATTGYAAVKKGRDHEISALEWGTIETKKIDPLPRRLTIIASDLRALIKRWKPDLAVIEKIYFATNAKTAINVAHARGVLLLTLFQNRIPILELTPLQMKSQITGFGSAPKNQVQTMVKRLLKLKNLPRPDDAADALALAICGSVKQ